MKLYRTLKTALAHSHEVRSLKITVDGDFPQELLGLPHLQELYLEGALTSFPSSLQHEWKELETLSLKVTGFDGDLRSLLQLPRLKNLKLIETELKQLLLPLGIHSPLRFLTLKSCQLKKLPEEFNQFTHLEELNLSGNCLQDLPAGIADLVSLKRMNLDSNHFEIYPAPLTRLPQLRHLSLDSNLFSEAEKARIQRQYHLTIH